MNDGFVGVIGGKLTFTHLTNKLDEKQYAALKIKCWTNMLNKHEKPARWLKPNFKGTGVSFKTIRNQEEWEQCFGELMGYVKYANEQFGMDMKLERNAS